MANTPEKIETTAKKRNSGYIICVTLIALFLGILLSTQYKKHIEAQKTGLSDSRQIAGLIALLKETQSKNTDMQKQLAKLRKDLYDISSGKNTSFLTNERIKKVYKIAGLTSLKGEGIVIKIVEQNAIENIGVDPASYNNDGYVHSDDILKIVNELRASGAEAISVNNERLVTTSEIVTSGNNIMVNQVKIKSPYIIKAIGPAGSMIGAVKMRGGIAEYLEVFGIKTEIEKSAEVIIPAYKGDIP